MRRHFQALKGQDVASKVAQMKLPIVEVAASGELANIAPIDPDSIVTTEYEVFQPSGSFSINTGVSRLSWSPGFQFTRYDNLGLRFTRRGLYQFHIVLDFYVPWSEIPTVTPIAGPDDNHLTMIYGPSRTQRLASNLEWRVGGRSHSVRGLVVCDGRTNTLTTSLIAMLNQEDLVEISVGFDHDGYNIPGAPYLSGNSSLTIIRAR